MLAKVIVEDGAGVTVLEIGVSLLLPFGHNLILKDAVYLPWEGI
jgi:hypothetical protein